MPVNLLPKMSLGEVGMMGVDGLQRLTEAEVVNIVEGISDVIAVQAVLGPWRDGATADDQRKHVTLTTGSASNYMREEWAHYFEGKVIRLWPHIEASKTGEDAMRVNAGKLLAVAKIIRMVMLPAGKDGEKTDVRSWLTQEGLNRGYAEMVQRAGTFEPIKGDTKELLTAHEKLLKDLGIEVIGEYEGTSRIRAYSHFREKAVTIDDIDRLTYSKLVQIIGEEAVEKHVHDGREQQPDRVQLKDVKAAIANAASQKVFHEDEQLGAGPWFGEHEGQLLLVKEHGVAIVEGTKLTTVKVPFNGGRLLDISSASGNWVDFNVLTRYLTEAEDERWCQNVFEECDDIFAKWYWRQKPAQRVITSLVICSFLQTLWDWRPEIFLTGGSDTGKSLLIHETLPALFGELEMAIHKPSEAGLRQMVKHHAKVVIIDEFEHDKHRQSIMELFRTASRRKGGKVIRGTQNQQGMSFQLRHILWAAAIETGLRKQPDRNRYIILDMEPIPALKRAQICLPSDRDLNDLGTRLLAVGLGHFYQARALALDLKSTQAPNVPGRSVEVFSVPASMFSAIFGHKLDEARESLRYWLTAWDFGDQSTRDEVAVLQEILTASVSMDHGVHKTVAVLLEDVRQGRGQETKAALERVGVKWVHKRNGNGERLWFNADTIRKDLLKNSDYAGHVIEQYLVVSPVFSVVHRVHFP